ncbi:MAG TPA: iron ABC transporter substrate-binding protein [Gaiellaceae bacterium]|nr:iron ABC transporter substrate-binding protein [Gaiellaceae bacterium]
MRARFAVALLCTLGLILGAAGCGSGDESGAQSGAAASGGSLTVYSGREEELVEPLFELFEEETGIDVEVRYGDSAELAATIAEEGENSPADAFFAQDPGSLGAVADEGLLAELPEDLLERVDERFRDDENRWVGTSGRVRVLAYNTEALDEAELPESVFELTDPSWRGRVGIAPTNGSFQAFVTAMRLTEGDDRAREWLEGLRENEPKVYESNTPIVEAVAAGEIDVGLVNHYYLYLVREEQPDAPVENHFFPGDDPGALVSAAGVGIVEGAENEEEARALVDFLLSEPGQRFYVDEAEEAEYPLIAGVEPKEGLPPLDELEGPDIDLAELGPELEETLELLNEVGFTT